MISFVFHSREDYETALNTVNLQVHLGNNYKCSNGVLEPKTGEISYLDLAIDKRKILLDLRDCVSKVSIMTEMSYCHKVIIV